MVCSFMDLRNKEVVNMKDGEKLGYVDDVEIDTEKSTIIALIIFGRERFFGIFGREDDIIISCKHIKLIGKDTILVDICDEYDNKPSKEPKYKKIRIENLYK